MANSISTLAVHLITDTSGMVKGFQIAQAQTTQFASNVERSNVRVSRFGRVAGDAAKELSKLGGAGGLAFKFAGIAGPAGAAATAIIGLSVGLARAADASEDFRIEKLREFGKISPDVKTLSDHFAQLREQFGIFAEGSGFSLKPITRDIADLTRSLNVLLYGAEKVQQLEAANKYARELAGKMAALKKQEEEAARAAKEAADQAKRQREELLKRGESIAKSLRTPGEIFNDTLKELRELATAGAITGEILQRGAGRAAEEFRKSVDSAKELKRELAGIPALEVGSQAFRTAVLNSRPSGGGGDAALAKASLEVEKKIQAGIEALVKRPPVTFKTASL